MVDLDPDLFDYCTITILPDMLIYIPLQSLIYMCAIKIKNHEQKCGKHRKIKENALLLLAVTVWPFLWCQTWRQCRKMDDYM